MGLQDILDAIEASGREQIEAIRKEASEKEAEILAAAQEEAKKIQDEECNKRLQTARRQRSKMLHEANLQKLKIEEDARERFIDDCLDATRQQLQDFRSDKNYPDFLSQMVEDALTALSASVDGKESMLLDSDPRDEEQIKKIFKNLSFDVKSTKGDKSWGGVTASSQDGRVKVINTLEERLERVTPYLRTSLAIHLQEDD